jgi:hypothetical protein
MFGRALLPLVARPRILILIALIIAVTVLPVAILALVESPGPDPGERAGLAIVLAGGPLGFLGCACGFAVRQAAWCSFAWTIPGFRRRLRIEFMASTLVLALATTVLAMVAFRPALALFPIVLLTSVAGFTLGCSFATVPESPFLFLLLPLAPFVVRVRWLEAAIERPLAFAAVTAMAAAVAFAATFATRSFRWAALREVAVPIAVGTKAWLTAHRARRQDAGPHATVARPDTVDFASFPYANTLVRRMLAMSRAMAPVEWFLLLAIGPLMGALSSGRLVPLPNASPMPWNWMAAGMVGLLHAMFPSLTFRATLPWSRRDHLAATWSVHVASALWCALVALPLFAVVTGALGSSGWTMDGAARMIGSTLLLFPAGWWVRKNPFGRTRFHVMRLALLVPVFQWGPKAADALLAAVVPTPPLQLTVVWALVLASQFAHWFLLKRDFATRDLAGAST